MSYITSVSTFSDLLEIFDRCIIWMKRLGLSIPSTRIDKYHKGLRELVEMYDSGDVRRLDAAQERYLDVLYEVSELIHIYRNFDGSEVEGMLEQLKYVKDGPETRSGERAADSSIKARNTAFELLVGATLHRVGFIIDLSNVEDVAANFENIHCVVECKRPSSVAKIVHSLNTALSQCKRRIERDAIPIALGIVAIDFSKVVNPQDGKLYCDSPDEIDRDLGFFIDHYSNEYISRSKLRFNKRCLGVLARVSTIAISRSTSTPYYAQQWRFIINSDVSEKHRAASNMVVSAMQNVLPSTNYARR